jgi:hypothetical protein
LAIERTLVLIRERSLLDLLDLSLVVVRQRPMTLGLAALFGIGPFAALNAWMFYSSPELESGLPLFLWMIEAPFATAPLTLVLGGLMFGQKATFGKVALSLLKAAFPLVLVHGILRIILFFWFPTRLAFANEVILLERGKWWKIVGRGRDLCSGRDGELYLLGMIQLVLTYLFALVFDIGVNRITQVLLLQDITFESTMGVALASWQFQLPIWIVVAFFAIVRFLLYIDQRIRLEGWEIELRLREVGEALEESRRW